MRESPWAVGNGRCGIPKEPEIESVTVGDCQGLTTDVDSATSKTSAPATAPGLYNLNSQVSLSWPTLPAIWTNSIINTDVLSHIVMLWDRVI
jgi:hypothetical protein